MIYSQDADDSSGVYVFETDDIIIEDSMPEEDSPDRAGQVTVFDREDIEASGARTVADVVERAPGVVVSRQGGILEPQSVSIRGGASEHVLVLVDGRAADSLWTGGYDLASIPVADIERIEVIRGAAAAVYGEGAVSGVINIITTAEGEAENNAELEYGFASFNTHQLDGRISGSFGESGLSGELSAGGLYTGGGYEYSFADTELVRTNNDGWAAHASGRLGLDSGELSGGGSFYASERGTPGILEFLTPEARMLNLRAEAGVSSLLETAGAGSFNVSAGYGYKYSRFSNNEEEVDESNENSSLTASAGWTLDWETLDWLFTLSADADYTFNCLDSTALTDSTGSSVTGVALQHAVSMHLILDLVKGKFDFSPAAGADWNLNDYKALDPARDLAFTWMASGGWAPFRTDFDEGPVYIKLNCGTAYRNPSFQDLFWPSGALAAGNPDLLPERSISADCGVNYTGFETDNFTTDFEAVGFFSSTKDLIQWMPSAGGVWRPGNIGSVYSGGIELAGSMRIEEITGGVSLDINAAYNWLKTVDADAESVNYLKQLAYRPEHAGNVSLQFCLPECFSLELAGSYIGYRFSNNADTRLIDQVIILSASAVYDFSENLGFSVSADNLLNKSYIDRLGYPVPGMEWCLKGRVNL